MFFLQLGNLGVNWKQGSDSTNHRCEQEIMRSLAG